MDKYGYDDFLEDMKNADIERISGQNNIERRLFDRMKIDLIDTFSDHLMQEYSWFLNCLKLRTDYLEEQEPYAGHVDLMYGMEAPTFEGDSRFKTIIDNFELSHEQRLVFILALLDIYAPHTLFEELAPYLEQYRSILGVYEYEQGCFLPTGRTALFLIAGRYMHRVNEATKILKQHPLVQHGLLVFETRTTPANPLLSSVIKPSISFLEYLMGEKDFEQLTIVKH